MIRLCSLPECRPFIPTLAQWHQQEWAYLNPGVKSVESRIAEFESHLGDDVVPSTVVAMEDGELLGSASLVEHDLSSRTDLSPWLASVFVAPDHRRRGIGGQLIRHLSDMAFAGGVETLHLYTTDRAAYYAHFGWSVAERTSHNGVAIVIMSLSAG
ncbi:GNAT family N-acetyltransferase [Lignipirellula cremea]|uniref:Acetyltransferase (GNAT) family protein n=1 Tax=Lignipirellula cremea TaxID=2528010 RepID=A0A518DPQ0_9BACT|nr:GNAT family N-acetyltransferase [Lignipirellula cremea]QDU93815.1 Acetyltransferase (GNAT) family protein [Lignipirellula cremea]